MWARAQSRELRDWQALGRKGRFSYRGLIAGPPPHQRKDIKLLRHLFPTKEVDVLINWTGADNLSSEALKAIIFTEAHAS
jgi:hypothetical protein